MEVFLIRHGIAEDHGARPTDAERQLTEAGRARTRLVARRLKELGVRLDLLLTSPLVRAYQTAEILLATGVARQLEVFAALAPGGDVGVFGQWLEAHAQVEGVGLVGHQPGLGLWAEFLAWGRSERGLEIKKAGVVRIALADRQVPGQLLWLLTPKVLG